MFIFAWLAGSKVLSVYVVTKKDLLDICWKSLSVFVLEYPLL